MEYILINFIRCWSNVKNNNYMIFQLRLAPIILTFSGMIIVTIKIVGKTPIVEGCCLHCPTILDLKIILQLHGHGNSIVVVFYIL